MPRSGCTWLTGTRQLRYCWNKRDDEYPGCQNVEPHTRIVREMSKGICTRRAADFVIGFTV